MANNANDIPDAEHARATKDGIGEGHSGESAANGSIRGARPGERGVINRPGGKDDDQEVESKPTTS